MYEIVFDKDDVEFLWGGVVFYRLAKGFSSGIQRDNHHIDLEGYICRELSRITGT